MKKYIPVIFNVVLLVLLYTAEGLYAEQPGVYWEFEEENNSEGWEILFGASDLIVSEGIMQATANGWFPSFKSPAFDISAKDYGIIRLRMKVSGASSARFIWETDSGDTGLISFPLASDTTFHDYWIPVYDLEKWSGRIIRFQKLEISGSNRIVGKKIEIDYIRVFSSGFKPVVDFFKPLRTIMKPGELVPLRAGIKNNGDREGSLTAELNLPYGFQLIEGSEQIEISSLEPGKTDTLAWTVICQDTGRYILNLSTISESADTGRATLQVHITDRYWKQDEFFLSAWSPPFAWYPPPFTDDVFDYYQKANFDLVLWISPDDAAVAMVEKFNMKCLLIVTSLVGGDTYLRAADNRPPPELTAEQLTNLDAVIAKYRDNPTVIGYFIIDEPNTLAFPNLGKVVAYLREKDPERLSFINLYPSTVSESGLGSATYDEHVEKFLDIVKPELLSYDRYIFFKDRDGGEYFSNLALIRKWAMRYDIPFCNIIQAIGTDQEPDLNWRTPNEAEHRWLVYSTLAYGARAIIWFHWHADWGVTGSADREQIYQSIQKTNAEIKNLGPYLMKLKPAGVYHTLNIPWGGIPLPENTILKSVSSNADLVTGFFKDQNNGDYILFMNKNYNDSVTAAISLNSLAGNIVCLDAETAQPVTVDHQDTAEGSSFTLSLRPGGGKLIFFEGLTDLYGQNLLPLPTDYRLKQNFPNPFNPETRIEYQIPVTTQVELAVYNSLGQKIKTLINKVQPAGAYQIIFNASQLASGIYYYKIRTAGFSQVGKMLLIK